PPLSTLSLHDALPIYQPPCVRLGEERPQPARTRGQRLDAVIREVPARQRRVRGPRCAEPDVRREALERDFGEAAIGRDLAAVDGDRKSTRLNSSHLGI